MGAFSACSGACLMDLLVTRGTHTPVLGTGIIVHMYTQNVDKLKKNILIMASLPLPLTAAALTVPVAAAAAKMLHPYVCYDAADSSAHAVVPFELRLKHLMRIQ
jgi:hypothetical protein